MVTVETRPFDDSELETVSGILTASQRRTDPIFGALLTFIVVSGAALLVWPWDRGIRSLVPILAGLLAAGFVHFRTRGRSARIALTSALQRELTDGNAEVTTYEVVDAINVAELEDEGSMYYLKLRDGRILFIAGQHLYDFEEEKRFPNTKFRAVRTPRTRELLSFVCLGDYLPATGRGRAFTVADYESGRVPEDGNVWEGDFDALRANL
jgi:hypothetical protein